MALARPQGPAGTSSLKTAAIVFAVLAVTAVGYTVYMFTQQSNMQAEVESARKSAAGGQQAVAEAQRDLDDVAVAVIGKEVDTGAQIKAALETVRKTVADDQLAKAARITADMPLADMLNNLYGLFRKTAEEAAKLQAERDDLTKQLEQALADLKAKSEAFDDEIARLTKQFEDLTRQSEQFRNEANAKLEELQAARTKEREDMAKELDAARKAKEEAENTLKAERNRAGELQNQLAQFKPSGSGGSALQVKDGIVVRTAPDGEVAYISLGRSDGVKPGMTFSVYSPVRGIPADGKGKATIEVSNVFDSSAECRVTSRTPSEPILSDDIIANPVFDRVRQFHFAVVGDFDLDFDGEPEDAAGREVIRLIERLGGKVVSKVDSNTDFVVVGSPPPPLAPVVPGSENEAAVTERNNQLTARRVAFETQLKEAKSLSIPILTRTQFLHFLGQMMPTNTPDDALPAL
jgi:hypothetical protein